MNQNELKAILRYDPLKGRFYWIENRGTKIKAGYEAGSFDAHGYGQIRICGKIYKEHRLVWLYVHGKWPLKQIDHINHDRRDNRIDNLRLADNIENHRNRPKQRNNTTGIVGVSVNKGKYRAYINVDGKQINIGRFTSLSDAEAARKIAEQQYGFHKNHGKGNGLSKGPKKFAVNGSEIETAV